MEYELLMTQRLREEQERRRLRRLERRRRAEEQRRREAASADVLDCEEHSNPDEGRAEPLAPRHVKHPWA
eukprot:CAMPEP_0172865928 /NCGR_PEP_ID=MMETSP1075-20121228/81691_1 /TAXON_ID=2916 /ORGANISM="Ceratium fusus, Strain PA161109" /LENGTH=69 /DNA_ID=CAMNT_0013715027 /DNA_START=87 /DNA_END=296 /DNA_ORIENTATION=+